MRRKGKYVTVLHNSSDFISIKIISLQEEYQILEVCIIDVVWGHFIIFIDETL